jgi:D-arabinose 1-dehydrogenase-like Zn-dependent alcohol dehydrogenase
VGSTMGTREELANLLSYLDVTGLRPQVGLELPMKHAEEAMRAMLEGETAGKIVLTR